MIGGATRATLPPISSFFAAPLISTASTDPPSQQVPPIRPSSLWQPWTQPPQPISTVPVNQAPPPVMQPPPAVPIMLPTPSVSTEPTPSTSTEFVPSRPTKQDRRLKRGMFYQQTCVKCTISMQSCLNYFKSLICES